MVPASEELFDSEDGSDGDSSLNYPTSAHLRERATWLRVALDRDSPVVKKENAIYGLLIEKRRGALYAIAAAYGQKFFLAVSEACKKVHGCGSSCMCLERSLLPYDVFVAIYIHEAWKENSRTDATDTLSSRTALELQQIKTSYSFLFEVELEVDIKRFAKCDLQKLLLRHVRGLAPAERGDTDEHMEEKEDYENRLSTLSEKVLDQTKCLKDDLVDNLVGKKEEYVSGVVSELAHKYKTYLVKELSRAPGCFERALLSIIKCAEDRPQYFAEELCKAMRDSTGAMRNENQIDRWTIVRIITTVTERDLVEIKEKYRKKVSSELEADVSHAFADGQDNLHPIRRLLNSRANRSRSHFSEDSVRNY